MITTLADQHLAQNAGRKYPLADNTTGVEDNAILDFRMAVRGVSAGTPVIATLTKVESVTGAKRIHVAATNVSLSSGKSIDTVVSEIAAGTDTTTEVFATGYFDIPTSMATGAFFRTVMTSSTATGAMAVTAAALSISDSATVNVQFARTVVVVDSLKVDSIQSSSSVDTLEIVDGKSDVTLTAAAVGPTAVLSGDIVLDPGYNTDPYIDGNNIRLDIAKGAGIKEFCQTATTGQTCDNVMFSINGERPGSNGDIKLVGDTGVTITPVPAENAIEIRLDEAANDVLLSTCEPVCG